MLEKIGDHHNIECGDILYHVLGEKVSVIKLTKHEREKNKKKIKVIMVKARYQDTIGMFHVHEFFLNELRCSVKTIKRGLLWKTYG